MKRKEKGTYGYIRQSRIYSVLRTLGLFILALGLYAIGYYTTGTNKNLMTIVAILGILPAAKSMVNSIMFLRFHSITEDAFQSYEASAQGYPLLYENVLTTTEQAYFLPALIYRNHSLCSFCDSVHDAKKLENHITDVFKQEHLDVTVKIFPDERLFLNRLQEMVKDAPTDPDLQETQTVYQIIRAISL